MDDPRWRVTVDRTRCVGSGQCAGVAPEAFRLDATTRRSHPVTEETAPADELLAAAECCPVEAVAIRVLGTGEAVFPPEE